MPHTPGPTKEDRAPTDAGVSIAKIRAFGVHILTASGAGFALLALFAAIDQRWTSMFAWLGLALLVDAFDGTLARRYKVAQVLPRWSGDSLDFVVDFVTYVFVPAYAIARSGLLPEHLAIPSALLIVITSTLYFADRRMKTADNYFRGFPVLWNLVAFYLLLLRPGPWICGVLVAALAALTFAPFPFIHPVRVARLRNLNIALMVVWSGLALIALIQDMKPGIWISGLLCAIGLYFLTAGYLRRSLRSSDEGHE
jgi:phosphatidylcholine synthase